MTGETKTTTIVKYEYKPQMAVGSVARAKAMLAAYQNDLDRALPEQGLITTAGLIQSALLAISGNRKLLACTQKSMLQSVMRAARFGLDCSGALRSAYLVPYKTTCQLIIGYGGFLDLARRAATTVDIDCQLVYDGDEIELVQGTQPVLTHRPDLQGIRSKDTIIGAYMVTTYKGGEKKIEYMPVDEIRAIGARCSQAYGKGPWQTDFGEMARKTVLRRGIKWLPLSPTEAGKLLAEAEEHDNEVMGMSGGDTGPSGEQRTEAILGRIDGRSDVVDVPATESPAKEPERATDGEAIPDWVGKD